MNDISFNPLVLEIPEIIQEPSTFAYLLSTDSKTRDSYTVQVEQGSLELTLVDFASVPLSFELNVILGENTQADIYVASLLSGNRDKTFKINVTHKGRSSASLTKRMGINSGSGHLSFLGASMILNGAKGSSTRQEGRITNLSLDAKSEVSPSLLIKENDVKASHGATVGAYDPKQLFYLRSRGLSLDESKKLITFGYFEPILAKLGDEKHIEEAKKKLEEVSL